MNFEQNENKEAVIDLTRIVTDEERGELWGELAEQKLHGVRSGEDARGTAHLAELPHINRQDLIDIDWAILDNIGELSLPDLTKLEQDEAKKIGSNGLNKSRANFYAMLRNKKMNEFAMKHVEKKWQEAA
ncbi:MAG: hypothetical protein HZA25_00825 [Candidatus Niyogibacteria bacterium]|nr:hypothetical protein [Candidatus Niyogibacteria bacterium]